MPPRQGTNFDPIGGKKPKRIRSPEMEWLGKNEPILEKQYPGMWVAIKGSELIAIGDSLEEVMDEAEAKGVQNPLVTAFRAKEYQDVILIRRADES